MKKSKLSIIVILTAAVILIGITLFSQSKNDEVYGVSSGTYYVDGKDELFQPHITFDVENSSYTFTYDLLSSCLNMGKIKIEKGRIIATTDDKKYTYVFEIIDNDTIKFIESESSEVVNVSGETVVADGTEFKFVE